MPYIKIEDRPELENACSTVQPDNAGELNYSLTLIAKNYIDKKGLNYATINEVIGVLECAKQELYRRVAGPYEDVKIKENGDVY